MDFSYSLKTSKDINQIVLDITENLNDIGFGVLETLDFKEIFEKKGIEFKKNYKLMEVCNPTAAKNVLETNPELGLLLPCTIAIYQENNQNIISLAKPTSLLSIVSNDNLQKLAKEIEENLIEIIEKSK
ncbi:MAG: DUF302 domain-containing protein [Nitrosopumilus sp.]|nr:DUF302 domain-containing protein [Nitrosopumilus sp.]